MNITAKKKAIIWTLKLRRTSMRNDMCCFQDFGYPVSGKDAVATMTLQSNLSKSALPWTRLYGGVSPLSNSGIDLGGLRNKRLLYGVITPTFFEATSARN